MGKIVPNSDGNGSGSAAEAAALAFVEGVSASMRPVEAVIRELAQSDVPVLLLAEVGAGKHATAQRIHAMSRRSAQPFLWFQCSSLQPDDLRFPQGSGDDPQGTIYLQELADLNAECQERLLEILPQSPGHGASVDGRARLICGSARDLEVEVKRGRLREDLYYRISGVCLRLPPLRQRREEIPQLIAFYLALYAGEMGKRIPKLSAEAEQRCRITPGEGICESCKMWPRPLWSWEMKSLSWAGCGD